MKEKYEQVHKCVRTEECLGNLARNGCTQIKSIILWKNHIGNVKNYMNKPVLLNLSTEYKIIANIFSNSFSKLVH